MRVPDCSSSLCTSFGIAYTAHCAKKLVFVSIAIEAKHFVSSGVVEDSTDSREAPRDDKCANHVLNEL